MTPDETKEAFLSECSKIKRDGIDDLVSWITRSDFFDAPASTRFHGSYKGGLAEHSLIVLNELRRLASLYKEECPEISDESILIVALFHDLCKVNCYVQEKRNRKNEFGRWEEYDSYRFEEKFQMGGHGSKSMYMVQYYIKLTPEEATAINCHMGFANLSPTDLSKVSSAYEVCSLAWLLHVADEAATFIHKT